jgi:hypothetical protein
MKCVILQPSYIPWRGYFHQIQKADVFVFYDDVQYDKRGWRNRNRIKTANGTIWLTVPVHARGSIIDNTPIDRICIDWSRPWQHKHQETIRRAYARAPFFASYAPRLDQLYARRDHYLADLVIAFTLALAQELDITATRFVRSSSLAVSGTKTERLLAILKQVHADHYISGPSARAYLDEEMLGKEGISVEYMEYGYPTYDQLHPPYDPQVSILDLLFMTGPHAGEYIWGPTGSGGD